MSARVAPARKAMRDGRNAEAAVTPLVGEFEIDADRRYRIITPAGFNWGSRNVDVHIDVYRVGKRAIVQQSMTNRTSRRGQFRRVRG